MATKNPTPLLYQLREGSVSDPFVDKVENIKLVAGRAILDEIPVKQFGIIVDGHRETGTNNPTGVQFYVDYTNGVLYFEPTKTGNVTVRYKGRGVVQIPSDRIFHPNAETNETLDLTFKRLEAKVKDAETKGNVAESQGNTASTQATHAKTQGDYAKSQGDYAKAQGDLAKGVVAGVIPNANQNASGLMSGADKTALDNAQKWKLTENNGDSKTVTGADFNNILTSGKYFANYTNLNSPYAFANIHVINKGGDVVQIAYNAQKPEVSIRTQAASQQFTSWRKLADDNTLTNTILGNKITVQSNANFIGKVSGSTTANPHIGGRRTAVGLADPTNNSLWVEYGDVGGNSYSRIQQIDNLVSATITTLLNGSQAQEKFSFNLIEHVQRTYGTIPGTTTADKVAWLKSNISKLTFNWWGFGSSPTGNKASVSWWVSNTSVWSSPVIYSNSIIQKFVRDTNVSQAIDTNGFVHFLAYAEPSDGTTASIINTDYVELQVELSTDIKTNLLLGGVQGHKLTLDNGRTPILSGADVNLDTYLDTGFYYVQQSVVGLPIVGAGYIEVLRADTSFAKQRFSTVLNNKLQVFERYYVHAAWSGWLRLTDNRTYISTLMGNSVTDQSNANFIGKIQDSIIANPHNARRSQGVSLLAPSSFVSDMPQTEINKLSSIDGQNSQMSGVVNTNMAQMLFSFNLIEHVQRTYGTIPGATTADKVSWLKFNVSRLTCNWWGFASSPGSTRAILGRWGMTTSAWGALASHTSASTSKNTIVDNHGQNIDSNGFVHFLAYADPSDGTTPSVINTDYVELIVDLDTSLKKNLAPVWIDAVLQNGWVEFDTALKVQYSLGLDGFVTLKGAVKSGTVGGSTPVFTLPSGFRPNRSVRTMVSSGSAIDKSYRVSVIPSGAVTLDQVTGTADNTYIHLEGVQFSLT